LVVSCVIQKLKAGEGLRQAGPPHGHRDRAAADQVSGFHACAASQELLPRKGLAPPRCLTQSQMDERSCDNDGDLSRIGIWRKLNNLPIAQFAKGRMFVQKSGR
jgi:hypothetical protein